MTKTWATLVAIAVLAVSACSSSRPTPTPGPSPTDVTYSDLSRTPLLSTIRMTGKVVDYYFAIDFKDILELDAGGRVIVQYEAEEHVDAGDTVEVIGSYRGDEVYPLVSGGEATAPTIDATSVTIIH